MSDNNDMVLMQKQLQRERQHLIDGIRETNKENRMEARRGNFSNTSHGKAFRNNHFEKLKSHLVQEFLNRDAGSFVAERNKAIKSFLDACRILRRYSGQSTVCEQIDLIDEKGKPKLTKYGHQDVKVVKHTDLNQEDINFFDTFDELFDIITHITLTAVLDNAMTPYANNIDKAAPSGKRLRDPRCRIKKTKDDLERFIGAEILFQTKLYLLSITMDGWVKGVHRYASEGGHANHYYHHYNMDRMVNRMKAEVKTNKAKLDAEIANAKREKRKLEIPANERKWINTAAVTVDALNAMEWDKHTVTTFLGQWVVDILLSNKCGINAFTTSKDSISIYDRDESGKEKKDRNGNLIIINKFSQMIYPNDKWKKRWSDYKQVSTDLEKDNELAEQYQHLSNLMPMIIKPQDIEHEAIGGWLGSTGVPLHTFKGTFNPSDEHLDFYNNQAASAFKINGFMLELLKTLKEGDGQYPIKLGSWKYHEKMPVASTSSRFDFKKPAHWDKLNKDQQKNYIIELFGEAEWLEKKAQAKKDHLNQETLKIEGIPSAQALNMAEELAKDDEIFFPVRYDFRGRVVMRVPHLNYQGPDHAKALLKFAEEMPKECNGRTEHWILVQLANTYGSKLDKESFSTRVNTMKSKLKEVEIVARMNDSRQEFQDGLKILKQVHKTGGDCFQFAAACREYYEIFIAKTKNTTDLIVSVDCSTSGQQIASVWLKDRELASDTNVISNQDGKPKDLYSRIFDRMLSLMEEDNKSFHLAALKSMKENGFGRAIVKAAFQGGQYGAGEKKQYQEIDAKIQSLEKENMLKLMEETPSGANEKDMFKHYFWIALEKVCKLNTLNDYFRTVADAAFVKGLERVKIKTPIGTELDIEYKPAKSRQVPTFHYGESSPRKTSILKEVDKPTPEQKEVQHKNWRMSLCANTTHAMDANLIAMALRDFPHPFTSVHDCLGCHAGSRMDDLRERLLQSFVRIADFNLFEEINKSNGLQVDHPPIGEWKTYAKEIRKSEYLTS